MTTYRPIESEEEMEAITRPIRPLDTVDISHWQGHVDGKKLYSQGIRNVFIKATDGSSRQPDARYKENVQMARDFGMTPGSYHFLYYNVEPEYQAERFLSTVMTGRPGDFLHVVDAEWNMVGGKDRWLSVGPGLADPIGRAKVILAMIGRYCLRIKEMSGQWPIIYTGSWWTSLIPQQMTKYKGSAGEVDFSQLKLWLAAYVSRLTNRYLPAPWEKTGPAIWQYSGNAKMDGVGTLTREIDLNKIVAPVETLCFG